MESLTLKNVKVLFTEFENPNFGSSLTLDVTDDEVRKSIEDFYKKNSINKGVAKIKDYTNPETKETTKQFTIKIAEFVELVPENGSRDDALKGIREIASLARDIKFGRGAIINVAIRSYEYNNSFGAGVSASAVAVVIVKSADFKNALDDLM